MGGDVSAVMRATLAIAVCLLLAACGADPIAAEVPTIAAGFRSCADVAQLAAAPSAYRDAPVYVANEMPVDEVMAWAATKPGFEELWIDRDHNGWISVGFSEQVADRQSELEQEFPGVGVVAVPVEVTAAALAALQQRVSDELGPLFPVSTWAAVNRGVVGIDIGVRSEERLAEVAARFAGDPICVDGRDPATIPPSGPQPTSGEGWRLLVDEAAIGHPYRTGIAWDMESLARLWRTIGLDGELPAVDFESEVVIWFGAVYSGSCPGIRMDDVVFDGDGRLVHPLIVHTDVESACTDDANPRAYVVAVERSMLPPAPFVIQLSADPPPVGVPEERTVVDAELRSPGAAAAPGEVHGDPSLPQPAVLEPGAFIEPGIDYDFGLYVHCGVRWLGDMNGVTWMTEVPDGDYVPDAWRGEMDGSQTIVVTLRLETGQPPTITLTRDGFALVYHPATEEPPGCD